MGRKPLDFVGNSLEDLRRFPDDARRRAGYELFQIESGDLPTDWRPMPDVGPGVIEIRIHVGTEHRVFYIAKYDEAVYVLHAFEKKSRKTAKRDIELGRLRLAEVHERRKRAANRRKP